MSKDCRFCGIKLVDENWYLANQKTKQYKCNKCAAIVDRQNALRRTVKLLSNNTIKAYNKIKEGYVYAISNQAWPGWIKIGMAVDAEDRCSSYQTSSPLRDYVLEFCKMFDDKGVAEKTAHHNARRLASDSNGEWFKMSKHDAITVIEGVTDETST
jgi:hypothetical protein|tara:strand:+ start:5567 stop:6034 length:468 start_codon:yes stop_codon:yes gene_type:complete